MAVKNITIVVAFWGVCFASCTNSNKTNPETPTKDTLKNNKSISMKSHISIFEIPATEISRAIDFYQTVLDIKIEKMEWPEIEMGIFPSEGQVVTGVIIKAEGYKPSADGVTIYLNGGDNLQVVLDKVEKKGGKILIPKTPHADEIGYFAIFLDSEGNKIGLHSPN
jgi:uncharacterized protein